MTSQWCRLRSLYACMFSLSICLSIYLSVGLSFFLYVYLSGYWSSSLTGPLLFVNLNFFCNFSALYPRCPEGSWESLNQKRKIRRIHPGNSKLKNNENNNTNNNNNKNTNNGNHNNKNNYSLNVKRVKLLLFNIVKSVRNTLTEWKSLSKRVKIIPKWVKITPKRVKMTQIEWISLFGELGSQRYSSFVSSCPLCAPP